MTVYVDNPRLGRVKSVHGYWCHMVTDGDVEELHQMADTIGLKRAWFQDHPRHPHYDITSGRRHKALAAGAVEVNDRQLLRIIQSRK